LTYTSSSPAFIRTVIDSPFLPDALPIFVGETVGGLAFQFAGKVRLNGPSSPRSRTPMTAIDRTAGLQAIKTTVIVCSIFLNFATDRKSTRLNSSHQIISYTVFFLKNKIN